MNTRIIKALVKKDFSLFVNNRFYFLITVVGIVFYIGLYFIMPSKTEESLDLAVYAPVVPPAFEQLAGQEGINIQYYDDEEKLKQAIMDGDYQVGISFPGDVIDTWAAGGKPEIIIYYASAALAETKDAVVMLFKELCYEQTGQTLNFETTYEILGPDTLGSQIALRDRMRPLIAVFILLLEIYSLASLISTEIEQGTVRALFVTPMRISDLFIAKGIIGIGLALGQSVLFMLLANGFNHQPLIILLTLLLGSIMVVGIGFLLASVARDVMAVTGWGMLIFIIFAIPGFGIVVPGLISDWGKIIPSYYLVDTVNRIANYGAGWTEVSINLAILTGFTLLVIWGGMTALGRRYR